MACSTCNKRRIARDAAKIKDPVKGGYSHLPIQQLEARLNAYKRKFCKNCDKMKICRYEDYVVCKGIK